MVDLIDMDIQNAEVVQSSIETLNSGVNLVHIATHSREVEQTIRSFAPRSGRARPMVSFATARLPLTGAISLLVWFGFSSGSVFSQHSLGTWKILDNMNTGGVYQVREETRQSIDVCVVREVIIKDEGCDGARVRHVIGPHLIVIPLPSGLIRDTLVKLQAETNSPITVWGAFVSRAGALIFGAHDLILAGLTFPLLSASKQVLWETATSYLFIFLSARALA
jgi:hypothetical protein